MKLVCRISIAVSVLLITLTNVSNGQNSFSKIKNNKPLPVELVYFYATVISNGVQLNFGTATETNNYGFDVERSDSAFNFSAIGFVEGNGNSNSPKHYQYIDTLVEMTGVVHYRLKQIDFTGSFEYSDTVVVDFISSVELIDDEIPGEFYLSNAYPNPFNHQTKIEFSIPYVSTITLEVFNSSGEIVNRVLTDSFPAGTYSTTIDLKEAVSGMYFVRLSSDNHSSVIKVILLK
ncbi:MAG: T9SS type A sorting domain-containing protein [Ignavibacteriales bacterium]|nr:MAG: T9SS type A sorting domain-containing protein [Ignavibacteriales bacterium]